jgi:hypothetical protein
MTDEPEFEELEHIPWAALAATRPDPLWRRGILALVVVAAVVVIGLVVRMILADNEVPLILAAPTTSAPMQPPETTIGVGLPAQEAGPAASLPAYSEADLMLISTEDEERLAAMQAEWFVRDYLTHDGDTSVAERVASLIPDETVVSDETVISDESLAPAQPVSAYVEWVRVFAVESPGPGRYRVEVVYRLLVGADGGFVREPAGAVAVELTIDIDGSARLQTLPEPIAVPVLLAIETDGS